ncbi:MAG: dihydrofolate reductase [Candidatus Shapirobacteria bacterium]
MKVTLYSEPSIDGYISTKDNDTSWVFALDSGKFLNFIKKSEAIIMGRQTFKFAEEDGDFPYDGAFNVVITSNKELLNRPKSDRYLFTNKSPKEILEYLKEKGFNKIGIIGGGKLNGSMIKESLINELILIYHPIILGTGIKLFEDVNIQNKLELISVKNLNLGLIQIKYKLN